MQAALENLYLQLTDSEVLLVPFVEARINGSLSVAIETSISSAGF